MSLQHLIQRHPALMVVGPSILIAFAFWSLIGRQQSTSLKEATAKLEKLKAAKAILEAEPKNEKLIALQNELATLTAQLEAAKLGGSRMVTKQANSNESDASTQTPAQAIADLLALCERNGLRCDGIETVAKQIAPTESANSVAKILEAVKQSTAQVAAPPPANDPKQPREIQLILFGTYQQVRQTLNELQGRPIGLTLVAVDMSESDGASANRKWILKVTV